MCLFQIFITSHCRLLMLCLDKSYAFVSAWALDKHKLSSDIHFMIVFLSSRRHGIILTATTVLWILTSSHEVMLQSRRGLLNILLQETPTRGLRLVTLASCSHKSYYYTSFSNDLSFWSMHLSFSFHVCRFYKRSGLHAH